MNNLDGVLRPLAKSLFADIGKEVTLRRDNGTVFDPVTGTTAPDIEDFTITVTPPTSYSRELVDGTLVQTSDLQVSMAAQDAPTVPTLVDQILIDGTEYSIQAVEPIYSGDLPAFYRIQVRR